MPTARSHPRLVRALLASTSLVTLVACSGGDGGTEPTPPPPTPTIALSLAPVSGSVQQGALAVTTATVTRAGGYTGAVTLTVEGLSGGATGTVGSLTTSGTTTTGTVTLGSGATTAPGTYNLTVRASGAGVAAVTAPYTLTVTAPPPPPPTPDFTLAVAPASATVQQGQASAALPLTLTRTNFAGDVTLALAGVVPQGVTATFAPALVGSGGTAATMTLNVGASAAPGTYNFTVTGTGAPGTRSAPFALTIAPAPSIALSVTPGGTLTLRQGNSDNARTVNIARTAYTGNVNLTATGLPAGLTASFSPDQVTGSSATLTLAATSSVIPGDYTLTIRGTGASPLPAGFAATTTVPVTITPAPAAQAIMLDFSGCIAPPVWLAVQDGDGPWTRVEPTGATYRFSLIESKASVAYVTSIGANFSTTVQQQSRAEWAGGPSARCGPIVPTEPSGQVLIVGLDQSDAAHVSYGGQSYINIFGDNPSFRASTQPAGIADQIVRRFKFTAERFEIMSATDQLIVRRDVDLASGAPWPTFNFDGPEVRSVTTAVMTPVGLQGDLPVYSMAYATGTGGPASPMCQLGTFAAAQRVPSAPFLAVGMPANLQRPTDRHSILLRTESTANGRRLMRDVFHTFGPRTLTLGAALPVPTITNVGGPYKRLRATVNVPAEYDDDVRFVYVGGGNSVAVSQTLGYMGGTTFAGTLPDFTGVPGFVSTWMPASNSAGNWTVTAVHEAFTGGICREGVTREAARDGTH